MCKYRILNFFTGDAGWTPDQWGHTRYKLFSGSGDSVTKQKQLNALIRVLLKVGISLLHLNALYVIAVTCSLV